MKSRRYALSLLEVIISLAVTGIILGMLWTSYRSLVLGRSHIQSYQECVVAEQMIILEMQRILGRIQPVGNKAGIWTDRDQLYICWDNGIQPDPSLSGKRVGVLKIRDSNLGLELEGSSAFWMIGEKASQITWQLFDPDLNLWKTTWDPSQPFLPAFIRFTMTRADRDFEHTFFLKETAGFACYEGS